MRNVICIVDAYSTGADLAPVFKKSGWQCIHVQSNAVIPDDYLPSFIPKNFDFLMVPDSDELSGFESIIEKLQLFDPAYIIPGTETGVKIADYLSHRLSKPGNAWESSTLRRNKFQMQEALNDGGLLSIPQFVTDDVIKAVDWAEQHQCWPVVVKPVDSAGADSVRFCENHVELEDAFNNILGKKNKLGLFNSTVLIQKRLRGQQFIVNAVSMDGMHLITEIWTDDKIPVSDASLICEKEILLPFRGEIQNTLVSYMKKALTLLGVDNGPSHSELIITEQGPVLIETAARMQGTIMHDAVISALGYSHVTLTAERYINPNDFLGKIHDKYNLKKNLYCVTLSSKEDGVVKNNRCKELIGQFPSYFGLMHTPEKGENIFRTTDLFTNPGIIYLCHDCEDQIKRDYIKIRELESDGLLFELM